MQPGQNPPQWAMTIPVMPEPGHNPPVLPLTMQAGLTDPDADGHQWVLFMLGDGTTAVTFRMAWQSAPAFGQAIANAMAGLAEQAAARQGPQLIVPPSGAIPDLGIHRNGHKP